MDFPMSLRACRRPGWVYIMTHPAWSRIGKNGMLKIGKTTRDPPHQAFTGRWISTESGADERCSPSMSKRLEVPSWMPSGSDLSLRRPQPGAGCVGRAAGRKVFCSCCLWRALPWPGWYPDDRRGTLGMRRERCSYHRRGNR
jgi:hypothetical protein